MKLNVAERMGAVHTDDDIVSEMGEGAISGVQVRAVAMAPTPDDSDDNVAEHDSDCEGCRICRKPAKRRARARNPRRTLNFPECG